MQDKLKDLNINGTVYKTEYITKYENRKIWEKPNPKNILSFIPGTIIKLFVKKGESIKAGKPLMILEAMKMKNTIAMPFDGKIKNLHVEEGQKIPNNYLMIEIE